MVSFKQFLYETVKDPNSPDEKRFKRLHTDKVDIENHPMFKDNIATDSVTKKKSRLADYEQGEDELMYDTSYSDEEEDDDDEYDLEEEMTDSQKKKREIIVKELKKKRDEFEKKYGDKWKDVMYATATKQAMKESNDLNESVINDLQKIVKTKSMDEIKLSNGDTIDVDIQTANVLLKIHDALNGSNKKKFEDALNKNEKMFMKMLDFAWSKVK